MKYSFILIWDIKSNENMPKLWCKYFMQPAHLSRLKSFQSYIYQIHNPYS